MADADDPNHPTDRTDPSDRRGEPVDRAVVEAATADASAPLTTPSPPWGGSTKRVIAVALAVAILLAAYLARNVLALTALAGLIAFLIAPIIRLLHVRLHVPRLLALFVSYIVVFIGVLAMGFLMADGIVGAVSEIDVGEAEDSLRGTATDALEGLREFRLAGYTVDLSDAVDPLLERLDDGASGSGSSGSNGSGGSDGSGGSSSGSSDDKRFSLSQEQITALFGGLTSGVRTLGGAILAALMSGIITVLVALYLNADTNKFLDGMRRSVPDGYEGDADQLAARTMRIWRGYLYGQLLNSTIVGLMMWLVLWIVGLPGAFVFALILGVLNMIPTFGPILAAIPAVLAALALGSNRLDWSSVSFAILVTIIYLVVVQLQANLVAPLITGRAVRLSPATVILGLIVGVQVGGLVGALLVVPVIATFKEYGRYTWAKLTDRDPFPSTQPVADYQPDATPQPGADAGVSAEPA